MNTKLTQKAKNNFEKDFFKLMNNAVFGKTMENVRKYRDIKLVTTERRRNHLVSEPNYHTTIFAENLLAMEMKKAQILISKPVYLGLSIIDLSKTVMYEFWYDSLKPKYSENAKPCYMDTNSFIIHVKTDYIYKDIAEDVEKRFDTLNFEIDSPLPTGKNKNMIGLMKDELGGQIMKEFVGLRAKTYSYLKDNNDEDKKAKEPKNCVIKRNLQFRDYKKCLKASQIENKIYYLEKKKTNVDCLKEDKKEFVKNKLILKTKQSFKSERYNVFTEVINKIASSSSDDKRMQSIDSIETYAYGTSKNLICKKKN